MKTRRNGLPNRVAIAVMGLTIAVATPADAQTSQPADPSFSIRAVGSLAVQRFAAGTTFDAVFGQPFGALFGGGARFERGRLFVEVSASRFRRTGERAFAVDGDGYGVDIPLTVTVTPVEFAAGYRFRPLRGSIVPYVGTGIGLYRYTESSPSAEAGEDVDLRHAGWLLLGGAEVRVHRWIAVAGDLHYSYVPGILGQAGLSQAVDEANLGGLAVRFKVVLGK
jgi:hypothetical protein